MSTGHYSRMNADEQVGDKISPSNDPIFDMKLRSSMRHNFKHTPDNIDSLRAGIGRTGNATRAAGSSAGFRVANGGLIPGAKARRSNDGDMMERIAATHIEHDMVANNAGAASRRRRKHVAARGPPPPPPPPPQTTLADRGAPAAEKEASPTLWSQIFCDGRFGALLLVVVIILVVVLVTTLICRANPSDHPDFTLDPRPTITPLSSLSRGSVFRS